MKLISEDINAFVRKLLNKKHPILAEIMMNWHKIVGTELSKKAHPLKVLSLNERGIKINHLHVKVDNSSASLEISMQQELILERIAVHLGFKGVHRLRIILS